MKLYLIRHGRQNSRLCNVNVDLSEEGYRQAALVGERLFRQNIQAVYSSDKMTNRSDGFTQQYYTADTEAKKTLSRLDGLAAEALDGFSFEEGFIEAVSGVEGVSAARTAGGVRVEYSQAINERQTLAVSVVFFSAPSGERFRIEKWNSTEKEISGESHPSVWDGGDLV